ncbi:MAG: hypothetical protein H7Z20_03340 [Bdellovibrio sp.]|nr:hypothetical protein [Methylotenera sp.]
MLKTWLQTLTDAETKTFKNEFWLKHNHDLNNGEFWADRIKKLTNNPTARLQLAIDNLPLPAAFREALIAIRALIRLKRSKSEIYEDEITLLYFLAAIHSFPVPYSEVLKEPGFNVIQSMPGDVFKNLPFTYKELGYENLILLKKTDIKFLIELWGEPEQHSTLNRIHNHLWREYELKLKTLRYIRHKEQLDSYLKMLKPEGDLKQLGIVGRINVAISAASKTIFRH